MKTEQLPRIDTNSVLYKKILPHCRLQAGEIWNDPEGRHRVGCIDAANIDAITALLNNQKAVLAVHDPPYNVHVGNAGSVQLGKTDIEHYIAWCRQWIAATIAVLAKTAGLYVWLGADQNDGFQPLPDFMIMMRAFPELRSRSFITMRNQRGYGTQHNWMAVRQELLYYCKGNPLFNIDAVYTDIPKILRGYYKTIQGVKTENIERSKSPTIRAGNVWVDIQQVFYRREENVPGCYAQKPIQALERIINAGSLPNDIVLDFFAHSGTTLIAAEKLRRRCYICDNDPVFTEITIRRLEHFRETGKTGWQYKNPFPEIAH